MNAERAGANCYAHTIYVPHAGQCSCDLAAENMKLLAMESRWEFAEGVVCEEITGARAVCRVGKKTGSVSSKT